MSSTRRISGLSCSISFGESSPSRFTSTLSITASKIFFRGPKRGAGEHRDDHPLPVLAGLVAEPDRRRLAAAAQLVLDDRRVEVERRPPAADHRAPRASSALAAISRSPP